MGVIRGVEMISFRDGLVGLSMGRAKFGSGGGGGGGGGCLQNWARLRYIWWLIWWSTISGLQGLADLQLLFWWSEVVVISWWCSCCVVVVVEIICVL